MELTVVIPTRDRRAILDETLGRLEAQSGAVRFEVLVVDDGSRDGTREAVREWAARSRLELYLLEQDRLGPAAGRNRALAAARSPVCLFLNDDSWPRPDLVVRHRDFHRRNPSPEAALLGAIVLPGDPLPTPFMRWFAELRFDYRGIEDPHDADGERFYTANVSAKTELLRRVGGFDEAFSYGYEDIDLGMRLQEHAMRLAYDAGAVVEHWHPMDLTTAIDVLSHFGRSLALFVERHPGWPRPRRPGARHRVKAGGLATLAAVGARTPRLQRETWRFLCHEAFREGYWAAVGGDAPAQRPSSDDALRIGRRLTRLATRDEDARMPAGYPGAPDA